MLFSSQTIKSVQSQFDKFHKDKKQFKKCEINQKRVTELLSTTEGQLKPYFIATEQKAKKLLSSNCQILEFDKEQILQQNSENNSCFYLVIEGEIVLFQKVFSN